MGVQLSRLHALALEMRPEALRRVTPLPVAAVAAAAMLAMLRRRVRLFATARQLAVKLLATVNANPLLQGIAIPSVIGYVLYLSRSLVNAIYFRVSKHFYCTVSISSKDQNFTPVVDFVARLQAQDNSLLVAETRRKRETRKDWINKWNGIGSRTPPEMDYRPTRNGTMTTFRFRGYRIMMWREKGETITTGWDRTPLELEEMTLATWAGDVNVLKDLIAAALLENFKEETDETKIFVLSDGWSGGWEKALTKKPRPKESIVLDGDLSAHVLEDARTFLSSKSWYRDRGIPYRRGYLLHGPPGCGKTSFCQVLAGEFQLDMCMLSLSNAKLNDAKLASYFRDAPENSIILLEDVDAVFVDRDVKKEGGSGGGTGVSFSGLLNAIDGVASQEGRLFFMTTNYPEKLDSALVRPGRCDVKVELKRASRSQMRNLFLRFFECESARADEFAAKLPEFELSMAQLQGHLLANRDSSADAVANVPRLLRASKPQQVQKLTVHDHLRRVGLERLAPLFAMHGYQYKSDLTGIDKVDTVKKWDVELQYDLSQTERLSRLLKEEDRLMKEDYPLASISTIRDAFIVAYRHCDEDGSSGRIEAMAKTLAEKLSHEGRGNISLWQLRWLLLQHSEAPERAVQNADTLVQSRTAPTARPAHHMTCFEFLTRAGCADEWYKFEDAGYRWASELKAGLKDQKAIQELKVCRQKAKILNVLIQNCSTKRNITCGLLHPDRERMSTMFRHCYPDCTRDEVDAFTVQLTTKAGAGLVSKIQIEAFLYDDDAEKASAGVNGGETKSRARRFAMPSEATKACLGELVNKPKKARPTPPPPRRVSKWIHKALLHEDKALGRYSRKFIDARLASREAVLAEPPLKVEDLESLGVNKLGDQRKIMRMLQRLRDGEDDGVLKKGDALRSMFGDGVVRAHREDDDVYEIDLRWGKMYAFEEKAGMEKRTNQGEQKARRTGKLSVVSLETQLSDVAVGVQAHEYKEH